MPQLDPHDLQRVAGTLHHYGDLTAGELNQHVRLSREVLSRCLARLQNQGKATYNPIRRTWCAAGQTVTA